MPIGGALSSGLAGVSGGLGNAHGTITLSTTQLSQAAAEARRQGQRIGQNLERTIGGGVANVQRDIQSLRAEIAAVGAIGGLATAFGLGAARDLRNYRIAFEQLLGSQEEADEVMTRLADGATKYGLELQGVFKLGRQLLPVLEGNVEATDEWTKRAARLRTVFPDAQQGAEMRAISEFLADQTISLQRLFNIPPGLILEAKEQFEDAGERMDFILDKMGATEQAALEMANPIVSIKNELRLIAAVGFTPLLEDLRETLPKYRQWLQDLRETHPELLRIGAGFTAAVAAGAPLLLLANQLLGTLQKVKALGIAGILGRAGLVGGVAVGGLIGAREGLQAIGRARGDERLEEIGIRDMLFTAAAAVVDSAAILSVALGFVAAEITKAFGIFFEAMGAFAARIGDFVPDILGGERLRTAGEELSVFGQQLRETTENEDLPRFVDEVDVARVEWRQAIARFLGVLPDPTAVTAPADVAHLNRGAMATRGTGGAGVSEFTEEELARIEAFNTFQADLRQIEADAQQARLETTRQYEAQRTQVIAQYEQQIAREAEDFARHRARENAQLAADIADMQAERAEQEAEWQEDLNERIADIQADAAKQRERMQEDHRDNLLQAASRLDARAVAEENRRFQRQITRFEEDLQARIDEEREAHEERVQQAREAEQERIDDMREAVAERQAIEDEERAIRLARMEEDHEAQLEQMDAAHQARLKQIDAQERQELAARRQSFRNEWMPAQRAMQIESLRAFEDYLEGWIRVQNKLLREPSFNTGGGTGGTGTGGDGGVQPTSQELMQMAIDAMQEAGWSPQRVHDQVRAMQGWSDAAIASWIERRFDVDVPGYRLGTAFVPRDMLAMLHRGEAVIDAQTAEFLRRGLRGSLASPQQTGAMVANSRTVTLQDGAVNIEVHAAPGMSAVDVGREVERRLENVFEALAA